MVARQPIMQLVDLDDIYLDSTQCCMLHHENSSRVQFITKIFFYRIKVKIEIAIIEPLRNQLPNIKYVQSITV